MKYPCTQVSAYQVPTYPPVFRQEYKDLLHRRLFCQSQKACDCLCPQPPKQHHHQPVFTTNDHETTSYTTRLCCQKHTAAVAPHSTPLPSPSRRANPSIRHHAAATRTRDLSSSQDSSATLRSRPRPTRLYDSTTGRT
ncbi:hypothetical protein BD289DRAFT_57665 [Coniella lustricola]|uniref:Uncharacterized protein n=1 Tax=Coniella lustricola TaxID=2025994 RepID=A0A2T3AI83_9PEZI|nr:hypothetical protein BD289DRAFT_57665 [Coniella lustricola]